MRTKTKLLYGETIGNPGGNVLDIEAVSGIAHEHGAPLMIDSTFATPYLCRPIEWGADIVTHSATKFIGGDGASIGRVAGEPGRLVWSKRPLPVVADPPPAHHWVSFPQTSRTSRDLCKPRGQG